MAPEAHKNSYKKFSESMFLAAVICGLFAAPLNSNAKKIFTDDIDVIDPDTGNTTVTIADGNISSDTFTAGANGITLTQPNASISALTVNNSGELLLGSNPIPITQSNLDFDSAEVKELASRPIATVKNSTILSGDRDASSGKFTIGLDSLDGGGNFYRVTGFEIINSTPSVFINTSNLNSVNVYTESGASQSIANASWTDIANLNLSFKFSNSGRGSLTIGRISSSYPNQDVVVKLHGYKLSSAPQN